MRNRTLLFVAITSVAALGVGSMLASGAGGGTGGCPCCMEMAGDAHALAATKPSDTAPATQPKFVNTKCPIKGSKIDPANVPAYLTREYKGQKVAFCCAGCPAAWDKLSDAEKDAKLAAAK